MYLNKMNPNLKFTLKQINKLKTKKGNFTQNRTKKGIFSARIAKHIQVKLHRKVVFVFTLNTSVISNLISLLSIVHVHTNSPFKKNPRKQATENDPHYFLRKFQLINSSIETNRTDTDTPHSSTGRNLQRLKLTGLRFIDWSKPTVPETDRTLNGCFKILMTLNFQPGRKLKYTRSVYRLIETYSD